MHIVSFRLSSGAAFGFLEEDARLARRVRCCYPRGFFLEE